MHDLAHIRKYHEARIKKYGAHSSMSLGWNTPCSQQTRFATLAEIADLTNRSILDIGCGRGDLCTFLFERFTGINYTGIEQIVSFYELALKQYSHLARTSFILGDFWTAVLPPADYLLASGALNYQNSDPDFLTKTIRRLYSACHLGLGINLLSATGYPAGQLSAYSPAEVVAFCQTLSPQVVLREGYLEGDFTVFLYTGEAELRS
jgi:SAM-dependent methyltransferase